MVPYLQLFHKMTITMRKISVYTLILAVLVSIVEAYPIYKYGLYKGSSTTVDACGEKRSKCFIWDLGLYPTCYKFSETESYSGAQSDATSLTYDLHPKCTDCSCSTGSGRKGGSLGDCNFFNYGGTYWLKLECVLNNATDSCPEDYVECAECVTGCKTAPTPTKSGGSIAAPYSFLVAVISIVLSAYATF